MRRVSRFATSLLSAIFFCLNVLPSNALPSNAQNEAFEAAEQVPANIYSTMSGGFWTVGKDEGFFRVVVVAGGVEHVGHRLFLQWLRSDARTQSYELVRTVNVTELNLAQGYLLEVKTSFGEFNSFRIDITAKSLRVKTRKFTITAKGDGKYTIRSR